MSALPVVGHPLDTWLLASRTVHLPFGAATVRLQRIGGRAQEVGRSDFLCTCLRMR